MTIDGTQSMPVPRTPAPGGMRELVHRTWRERRLFSVLFELTYRCNLDCFFCYNDLGRSGVPLPTKRLEGVLEELAAMGVFNVAFSGGEPLAHPDFLRLGGRARELGFVVRVKSNGHALRGELARRLRDEVDPFAVEISLHGAVAATHDRQTRVAGSFERLRANLGELRQLGVRVRLQSTLTRWNEDECEAMFAFADSFDLPLRFDTHVTARDDGNLEPLQIAPSEAGLRTLYAVLAARGAAARAAAGLSAPIGAAAPATAVQPESPADDLPHCGAGTSGLAVDPYGDVFACVQWRRALGNLHHQTVREIWEGSQVLAEVRRLARAARDVVEAAGDAAPFDFCPGAAESRYGDPLRLPPEAARERALQREATAPRVRLPVVR